MSEIRQIRAKSSRKLTLESFIQLIIVGLGADSFEKKKELKYNETFPGSLIYLAESKIFREDISTRYKLVKSALEYNNSHEMILSSKQEVDLIYYVAKYAHLLEKNTEYEFHKKKLKSQGKLGEKRIKHLEKGREWLLKDVFIPIIIIIFLVTLVILIVSW